MPRFEILDHGGSTLFWSDTLEGARGWIRYNGMPGDWIWDTEIDEEVR